MRLLFIGLMLAFAFGAPARAQNDPTNNEQRTTRELEALKRADEDIARNPGDHQPAGILGYAIARAQEGHSEEALRLAYFAEVRLRMDDLYVRSLFPLEQSAPDDERRDELYEVYDLNIFVRDIPPARRRALFEEAIRLEARAPRRYESSSFGDPPRRQLASLRTQAVAAARARMEEVAAKDTANAEIEASIASGAPAAEASAYIPQPWRTRVRALKSIRLSRECLLVSKLIATPPGAAPQAFLLDCRTLASERQNETPYQWHSWADLGETGRIVSPGLGIVSVVSRGGDAYLMPGVAGDVGSATLIGADGRVQVLTPEGQDRFGWFKQVSPSGRYAWTTEDEVADLDANRIVMRRGAADSRDESYGHVWNFITETERGEPQLVGVRASTRRGCNEDECPSYLVVLDVQSGQVRTLRLPPRNHEPMDPYGLRQAAIEIVRQQEASQTTPIQTPPITPGVETFPNIESWRAASESQNRAQREAPRRAQPEARRPPGIAIADLDSMQIVWTGASVEAPPPRLGIGCLTRGMKRYYPHDARAREPPNLLVSLNGEGFVLASSPRQAPTACAISADGARLVILAPPFLHLYQITR